jgi:hypothetical protein
LEVKQQTNVILFQNFCIILYSMYSERIRGEEISAAADDDVKRETIL